MPDNKATIIVATVLLLGLQGCSGGMNLARLNPMNLLSGSSDSADDAEPLAEEVVVARRSDGRPMVADVLDLRIEPTRFGAILRAEGRMAYPHVALPDLRAEHGGLPDDEGTLHFDMVADRQGQQSDRAFSLNSAISGASAPQDSTALATVPVSAGTYVAAKTLAGAARIVVTARSGSVTLPLR